MYFQVVISNSNNVTRCLSDVSTMYFRAHVLAGSYRFNGNDVGALRKKGVKIILHATDNAAGTAYRRSQRFEEINKFRKGRALTPADI